MDEQDRRAQRSAKADPSLVSEVRAFTSKMRSGKISIEKANLLALLGDEIASAATGITPAETVAEVIEPLGEDVKTLVSMYFQLLGVENLLLLAPRGGDRFVVDDEFGFDIMGEGLIEDLGVIKENIRRNLDNYMIGSDSLEFSFCMVAPQLATTFFSEVFGRDKTKQKKVRNLIAAVNVLSNVPSGLYVSPDMPRTISRKIIYMKKKFKRQISYFEKAGYSQEYLLANLRTFLPDVLYG